MNTHDPGARSQKLSRRGLTLIELIAVVLIVGVVVALLLPATRRARPAARRTQCKNNLKQIGLALHNYHDTYGAFPPAYTVDENGKPLHSWRTLILPFAEQQTLYTKIDLSKAWDDPVNEEVRKSAVSLYSCPAHSIDVPRDHTSYLAVVTANSCFQPTASREKADVTDDHSQTLMVVEVDSDRAVHWMSPQDAGESHLLQILPKSKHNHTGGANVLLVDGSVKFISETLPEATRRALISIDGGEKIGADW